MEFPQVKTHLIHTSGEAPPPPPPHSPCYKSMDFLPVLILLEEFGYWRYRAAQNDPYQLSDVENQSCHMTSMQSILTNQEASSASLFIPFVDDEN